MKAIATSILLCVTSLGAAAAEAPGFACPTGEWLGWSLTATPDAETPIFAGNKNTRIATVCNCTQPLPDVDAGVWVDTWQEEKAKGGRVFGKPIVTKKKKAAAKPGEDAPGDEPKPGPGVDAYYLPGSSCTLVGPGAVMLRTVDHNGPKWGVWRLEKQ